MTEFVGSDVSHPAADAFSRAFAGAPVGMALVSIAPESGGRPLAVNRAFCEFFGYTEAEMLAIVPTSLSHPEDLDIGVPETAQMLAGERDRYVIEKRFVRRGGEVLWGRLHVSLVRDGGGTPSHVLTHLEDITSEHTAAEALRLSEERFRRLAESAEDSIFIYRILPTAGFEYVNPAAERFTGYTIEEHLADPRLVARIIHPDDLPRLQDPRLGFDGPVELRFIRRDGTVLWTEFRAVPILDDAGAVAGLQGIARDITQRRESERELRRLAERDVLTGLFNRRRFGEALAEYLERSRRYGEGFALMLVDIDYFKAVNDSLGHSAGDDVLRALGETLRRRLRASDVIGRLGGDEFAILLPRTTEGEAEAVAKSLLEVVPAEIRSVPITISVGVAAVTSGSEITEEEVLLAADAALYRAKEDGRNRIARFSTLPATGFAWVQRIRSAIAGRRFVLDAQPIVDLRTHRVVSHELLVRMLGDDGERIPTGAFLPIAERFDLVRALDRIVVEEAVAIAARGIAVNVNLSGRTAGDREMLEWLAATITAAAVDARLLTFEITETAAVATLSDAGELVESLLELGCGVALDDFGTGFGSFSYLKQLRVTQLKIDMEFIRGLPASRIDQRIVAAIIDVAATAGMVTIAEGVEDAETLALLERYGVHCAQGYHIARPAPIEDVLGPGGPSALH